MAHPSMVTHLWDRPIRQKLIMLMTASSAVAVLVAGSAIMVFELVTYRANMRKQAMATARDIGYYSAPALMFSDPVDAQQTLDGLSLRPEVTAAALYGRDGQVMADYVQRGALLDAALRLPPPGPEAHRFRQGRVQVFHPVFYAGKPVGTVYILVGMQAMYRSLARNAGILVAVLLLALLSSRFAAARLQAVVSAPILELAATAHRVVHEKDYRIRATRMCNDETGNLTDSFNQMLTHIQIRDRELRQARDELEARVQQRTAALSAANTSLQHAMEERQQADRALQAEQHLLHSLMDHIPDSIYFKDRESRFLRVNKAQANHLGLADPSQAVGKTDHDYFAGPFAASARADELQIMKTGDALINKEEEMQWPDQTHTWVYATKLPLHDAKGNVVGTFGVSHDITALKLAEAALQSKSNELTRSNRDLAQFAYVASHDLQEPLRMVTSYLQLLERRYTDTLDDTAREFISFAVDGAKRMKGLINDLLVYSRVGTKGHPFQPVDAEAVLGRVLKNLEVAIAEKGAVITHDPLPVVTVDETQFLQLLQNLVSNAIKFQATHIPEIHIGVVEQATAYQWCVRDNGIGIAAKDQDAVFDIFHRLQSQSAYAGSGIGLALCKRIVERHGGRIWVESAPGQGAAFFFTLPKTALNTEG